MLRQLDDAPAERFLRGELAPVPNRAQRFIPTLSNLSPTQDVTHAGVGMAVVDALASPDPSSHVPRAATLQLAYASDMR